MLHLKSIDVIDVRLDLIDLFFRVFNIAISGKHENYELVWFVRYWA